VFSIKQIASCDKSIPIGITKPVLVQSENGEHFVMKYIHDDCSGKILFNELVAYRLACLLGVPIPESHLGELNFNNVRHSEILRPSIGKESTVFLSSYIKGNTDITPVILKYINNQEDIPRIILFDQIIQNEDRGCNKGNLFFDRKQKRLVAIDHSHVFKLGEIWDEKSLNKLSNNSPSLVDTVQYRGYGMLIPYIKGHSPFYTVENRIRSLSRKDVDDVFKGIPSEWGISDSEIDAVKGFIVTQFDRVHDIIVLIKNQFNL
jgi:hypothetical protein